LVIHDVAIATRDSKLRYLCISLMEKLGLDFVVCAPNESTCGSAKCTIALNEEATELEHHNNRAVLIDDDFDADRVGISVMSMLYDLNNPTFTSIGVDPGMRYGLALLLDGLMVYSSICPSPRKAAAITSHWSRIVSQLFPTAELVVRIGTGSRLYLTLYLRELENTGIERIVELVDEHHTTLRGESDISSAALIAGRRGTIFHGSPLPLDYKTGYIRSLKKYIRRATDDTKKLSTENAKDILSGSSSIDSFLESP